MPEALHLEMKPIDAWIDCFIVVLRTTVRTTNLGVILLGAGLSALLIYCLTSELFSTNSPTVIYGDACERIKSSPQVCIISSFNIVVIFTHCCRLRNT